MMKNIIYSFFMLVLITSCISEDHFGKSPYGNIKKIVVSNQSGNASINQDSLSISIEIPSGVDLTVVTIQEVIFSTFAQSNKIVGDTLDLSKEAVIEVISEDGVLHQWKVFPFVASATPQLDNWKLDQWYKTASNYFEPGADASSTIWGTGNQGTQILNKLATIPEDLGGGDLAAKMITLDNGTLAGTFGAPISAGSIFTGVFNPDKIDPSNPSAAIEFGTPFTGRPKKVRLKYAYVPGLENKDKDGNVLEYGDACDIYALLEIRLSGKIERLATAWVRSTDTQKELSVLEIPFTYGPLDNSFPDYMKPPAGQAYVSPDSAAFVLPTHITFVASSSFAGAQFAGAIDSELIINEVEMVYE